MSQLYIALIISLRHSPFHVRAFRSVSLLFFINGNVIGNNNTSRLLTPFFILLFHHIDFSLDLIL